MRNFPAKVNENELSKDLISSIEVFQNWRFMVIFHIALYSSMTDEFLC